MCLLVLAWRSHPRYRLVVAGNRDEFHDRPAAPLQWWADEPSILAGRDLAAGGTWMGVSRTARFGVVTNFREADPRPAAGAPSRGHLVPGFLRSGDRPRPYAAALAGTARAFAGFNLLVGDDTELHYVSNVPEPQSRALAPGIYGLSNNRLDEPWPKLVRTRQRVASILAEGNPEPGRLFEALADATPDASGEPSPDGLPADLERALSAPFVRHERYGTRCSTVTLVGADGRAVVHERRFDARGTQTGATRIEFACGPP